MAAHKPNSTHRTSSESDWLGIETLPGCFADLNDEIRENVVVPKDGQRSADHQQVLAGLVTIAGRWMSKAIRLN